MEMDDPFGDDINDIDLHFIVEQTVEGIFYLLMDSNGEDDAMDLRSRFQRKDKDRISFHKMFNQNLLSRWAKTNMTRGAQMETIEVKLGVI